jgi:hypothetical protein
MAGEMDAIDDLSPMYYEDLLLRFVFSAPIVTHKAVVDHVITVSSKYELR